jgi:hypothetical protein
VKNEAYPFDQTKINNYFFISVGKKRIVKHVAFTPIGVGNLVNMGFGDLQPGGAVDDKANSNNGDMVRVLATMVHILLDFTTNFPAVEVFFTGSTDERTRLYSRIVRTYYRTFSKDFRINVLVSDGQNLVEVPFETGAKSEFFGFVIKRIL